MNVRKVKNFLSCEIPSFRTGLQTCQRILEEWEVRRKCGEMQRKALDPVCCTVGPPDPQDYSALVSPSIGSVFPALLQLG